MIPGLGCSHKQGTGQVVADVLASLTAGLPEVDALSDVSS